MVRAEIVGADGAIFDLLEEIHCLSFIKYFEGLPHIRPLFLKANKLQLRFLPFPSFLIIKK
ncbi:MAG: hypothetical protein ACJAYJ_000704 [Saprospiraceae bacterium]